MKLDLYVDGSWSPTKNMYGCGIVILHEGKVLKEFSVPGTETAFNKFHNIAGEIFAAMLGFQYIEEHYENPEVTCHYDYAGLELWTNGKWNANSSLAIAYQEVVKELPYPVTFKKVRAHTGDTYNELADTLARRAVGLS